MWRMFYKYVAPTAPGNLAQNVYRKLRFEFVRTPLFATDLFVTEFEYVSVVIFHPEFFQQINVFVAE